VQKEEISFDTDGALCGADTGQTLCWAFSALVTQWVLEISRATVSHTSW